MMNICTKGIPFHVKKCLIMWQSPITLQTVDVFILKYIKIYPTNFVSYHCVFILQIMTMQN